MAKMLPSEGHRNARGRGSVPPAGHSGDAALACQIWGQPSETTPRPAGRNFESRSAGGDWIKARPELKREEPSWIIPVVASVKMSAKPLRVDALCFFFLPRSAANSVMLLRAVLAI